MGQTCELCGGQAMVFCEADKATLCWTCDATIHSANYLFARHTRLLLCAKCSAETECRASGPHPSRLSRFCAACDPASSSIDGTVRDPILRECQDDSEDWQPGSTDDPLRTQGSGVYCCESEESHDNQSRPAAEKSQCGGLRAKSKQKLEVSVRRLDKEELDRVRHVRRRPVRARKRNSKRNATSSSMLRRYLSEGTLNSCQFSRINAICTTNARTCSHL